MGLIAKPLPGSPNIPVAGSPPDAPFIRIPPITTPAPAPQTAPVAPSPAPAPALAPPDAAGLTANPAAVAAMPQDPTTAPGYVPVMPTRLFTRVPLPLTGQDPQKEVLPNEVVPGLGWGDAVAEAAKGSIFGSMFGYSDTFWRDGYSLDNGYRAAADPQVHGDNADPLYAAQLPKFLELNNTEDAAALKSQLQTDAARAQKFSQESWAQWIMTSPITIAGDPTTWAMLIPGVGEVAAAAKVVKGAETVFRAGQIATRSAGEIVARNAALGAGAGFFSSTLSEQARGGTSPADTVIGTAAGAALGAGLGLFLSRFHGPEVTARITQAANNELKLIPADGNATAAAFGREVLAAQGTPESAGAAVTPRSIEDFKIKGWSARFMARVASKMNLNPLFRNATARSVTAQEIGMGLMDAPFVRQMHSEGRSMGPSVETAVAYWRGKGAQVESFAHDTYLEGYKSGAYKWTRAEFETRVADRVNDGSLEGPAPATGTAEHYLMQVAQKDRQLLNEMEDSMKEVGLVGKDFVSPDGANRYLPKMVKAEVIRAREGDYMTILKAAMREKFPMNSLGGAKGEAPVSSTDYADFIDEVANQVLIKTQGWGNVPSVTLNEAMKLPAFKGSTKERTLNIPRDFTTRTPDGRVIQYKDFFEQDMREIRRRYTKSQGAEIELHRKGFLGSAMSAKEAKMAQEYAALSAQIPDGNLKAKIKLEAEHADQRSIINGLINRLRGLDHAAIQNSKFAKVGRVLSWTGAPISLPFVTLTSLNDAARLVAAQGPILFLRRSIPGLRRGISSLIIGFNKGELKQEMLGIATGFERMQHNNHIAIADVLAENIQMGAIQKGARVMNHYFMNMTGLPHWTDGVKAWASDLISTRMLEAGDRLVSGQALKQRDMEWASRLGWSEGHLRDLAELKKEGIITNKSGEGVYFNMDAWDNSKLVQGRKADFIKQHSDAVAKLDPKAKDFAAKKAVLDARLEDETRIESRRILQLKRDTVAGLHSEANKTIVTPGIGSMPLIATDPRFRPLFMFKSYIFDAYGKMLVSGLQGPSLWWATELATSMYISHAVLPIKLYAQGRDKEAEALMKNPVRWGALAAEQDGALGMVSEVFNLYGKATGQQTRISDLVPRMVGEKNTLPQGVKGKPNLRPDIPGAILGPVGSMAEGAITAVQKLAEMGYAHANHEYQPPLTDVQKGRLIKAVPGGAGAYGIYNAGKAAYNYVKGQ